MRRVAYTYNSLFMRSQQAEKKADLVKTDGLIEN